MRDGHKKRTQGKRHGPACSSTEEILRSHPRHPLLCSYTAMRTIVCAQRTPNSTMDKTEKNFQLLCKGALSWLCALFQCATSRSCIWWYWGPRIVEGVTHPLSGTCKNLSIVVMIYCCFVMALCRQEMCLPVLSSFLIDCWHLIYC